MADLLASGWIYGSMVALIALPGLWLCWRGLLRDRARSPRCPKCWYDLRTVIVTADAAAAPLRRSQQQVALPVTCPECGRVVKKKRKLYRIRRHWLPLLAGVSLLALCAYTPILRDRVLRLKETIGTALVPTTYYVLALPALDDDKLTLISKRSIEMVEVDQDDGSRSRRLVLSRGRPVSSTYKAVPQLWAWQNELLARSCRQIVFDSTGFRQKDALDLIAALVDAKDLGGARAAVALLEHPSSDLRGRAIDLLKFCRLRPAGYSEALADRVMLDPDSSMKLGAGALLASMGRKDLMPLSDERLAALMDAYTQEPEFIVWTLIGSTLAEASHRPSETIRSALERWMLDWKKDNQNKGVSLPLLTALRRSQHRGDPLRLDVKDHPIEMRRGEQKVIHLIVTNVDEERLTVNYGSSPLRWAMILRQGDTVIREWKTSVPSLPTGNPFPLEAGASFEITLELKAILGDLPPGEYEATFVYYSPWRGLAVEGLDLHDLMGIPARVKLSVKEGK